MKTLLSLLVAGGVALAAVTAPHQAQAHASFSFGLFAPIGFPAVYAPPPPPRVVYVQPQPVVYQQPAPAYGRVICDAYGERCYREAWHRHYYEPAGYY